jgi:thiamine pyrophosphate-dependent acetolactate synthase large subunit-like protein
LGDAKLVLRQLGDEVRRQIGENGRRGNEDMAKEIKAVKEEWLNEWLARLTSDDTPISPYRVIWELEKGLDKANSIVTHDSRNPRDQMVPFYTATTPRGYIGWGNSTQLGSGLGLAMGAKLAAPQKTVLNVMGDTAVGMCGTDFETAAREKIGIITVILNNGAMGATKRTSLSPPKSTVPSSSPETTLNWPIAWVPMPRTLPNRARLGRRWSGPSVSRPLGDPWYWR